jgi:hypothetical protein
MTRSASLASSASAASAGAGRAGSDAADGALQAGSDAADGALQAVLAAEEAASYGYGVVGAHLTGSKRAAAVADWVAHQRARDKLEAMLTARRVTPQPAAVAYGLPIAVRTESEAVSLAVILEERITAAYLRLVVLGDTALRELGAQRMQASAVRAARWRGSTVAFPGLPASALAGPKRRRRAGRQ